jgi:hypothetical protein
VLGDQVAGRQQAGQVAPVVAGDASPAAPFLHSRHTDADHAGDVSPREAEVGKSPKQLRGCFLAAGRRLRGLPGESRAAVQVFGLGGRLGLTSDRASELRQQLHGKFGWLTPGAGVALVVAGLVLSMSAGMAEKCGSA